MQKKVKAYLFRNLLSNDSFRAVRKLNLEFGKIIE